MDPRDRIPHDDWADQDLLTRAEAAERLAAEIADVKARVDAGETDEVTLRRLAALQEAYAQLADGREPN
ncbi:hypothetical protein [Mycobacterium shimoidei]|uniref:hypothetical protein n=1 Tax=Mycobacterium shimoidei TaxID=29313 RepID=UPI0008484231|nr:hypothetical protein [Mycobacterium shimoidei]MCV7257200.1 hypothetical protein [Mycobacterium shimoidei]ODR14534.1 hypothetical protein BHQ16_06005 [Mycobacterium shimoidei]ORW80651.1 hypothetical protein AWC26_11680 [Mycobacterium shimoidei]